MHTPSPHADAPPGAEAPGSRQASHVKRSEQGCYITQARAGEQHWHSQSPSVLPSHCRGAIPGRARERLGPHGLSSPARGRGRPGAQPRGMCAEPQAQAAAAT